MDLFNFDQIIDLLRVEPGHGIIQCFLLFMIWLQSKGVRKELVSLKESLEATKTTDERRFGGIELRLVNLENKKA
jgi:hypothetical protein